MSSIDIHHWVRKRETRNCHGKSMWETAFVVLKRETLPHPNVLGSDQYWNTSYVCSKLAISGSHFPASECSIGIHHKCEIGKQEIDTENRAESQYVKLRLGCKSGKLPISVSYVPAPECSVRCPILKYITYLVRNWINMTICLQKRETRESFSRIRMYWKLSNNGIES